MKQTYQGDPRFMVICFHIACIFIIIIFFIYFFNAHGFSIHFRLIICRFGVRYLNRRLNETKKMFYGYIERPFETKSRIDIYCSKFQISKVESDHQLIPGCFT